MRAKRTYKIANAVAVNARNYWDETGEPKLREWQQGEACFYIGWSERQELHVLLDDDADERDNYSSAETAYCSLWDKVPLSFVADGEVVGAMNLGFFDICGDGVNEITLSELWIAALLQSYFDKVRAGICLQMAGTLQLASKLKLHARLACYEFKHEGRYAAFKAMGIKHEIAKYVESFYEKSSTLPTGDHTLSSGLSVNFPSD